MSEKVNYLEKGFSADQVREIEEGLEEDLDVSLYAKKEFMAIQMRQIRIGLEQGLDVSFYADAAYDWFQMEEIRIGLEKSLKIEAYASPDIPYDKMRQIREGIQVGIDLTPYIYLKAGILKELRLALLSKVNIIEYIKDGYDEEQLREIRLAMEKKLDIHNYLSKDFRGISIGEIANGLEKGLDVSIYADPQFGWQQMREIRIGLENRVDISIYARPLYSWQQMHEIRIGLESGIDVSSYKSLMYTATDMKRMRRRIMGEDEDAQKLETAVVVFRDYVITVSGDEMAAYIEVPEKAGKVTRQEILHALKEKGITRGILESGLEELVSGKGYDKNVLIAKGAQPQTGKDGYYEYFFKVQLDKAPKMLEDGSVDYHDVQWFEVVEQGQKLAYYHSAENGVCGYTVTGKIIQGRKGKEQSMLMGKGFAVSEDGKTYTATVKGRVDLYDNRLEVSKILFVNEITHTTGDITFDGCVCVLGNVSGGAAIHATEDIVIDGFVEGAIIESSGGSILLRQGVNASGTGSIKALKGITGSFFEAVSIYTNGDITANYCLNCDLYAEGQITMVGSKGTLAGGDVTAVRGLFAYNLGNRAGIPTHVRLGVNEGIMQRGTRIENRIKEVTRELSILGNAYMDFQKKYPPEVRNTMEMYLKIESAIFTKEREIEHLYEAKQLHEENIEKIGCARAVIKGTLFEGIIIEIDRQRWISPSTSNVTVRRVNNKIVVFTN